MTARVLVVDDVDANLKLLALEICLSERADVMLLDVMMPGTDGFEACRGLKAAAHPAYPGDHGDRARSTIRPGEGLEAGADDFLTKPVEDIALVKRVRNLARLKMLTDEMLMRASTEEQMGLAGALASRFDQGAPAAKSFVVEDRDKS